MPKVDEMPGVDEGRGEKPEKVRRIRKELLLSADLVARLDGHAGVTHQTSSEVAEVILAGRLPHVPKSFTSLLP